MKIGATEIRSCKIGSTQINEVRIGSTLVWSYSSFDPDAQLFITNAAITDTTQQTAINQLVLDLKSYGIWTKMKALYPFVGGTAAQHKYNLRNPLDTDAAFRLVFNGGWTHSANGALPNGTNAFAETFYNPSLNESLNSTHLSYYSRTNSVINNQVEIGANAPAHFLSYRFEPTITYQGLNSADASRASITPTNNLYIGNRIASTTAKFFRAGSLIYADNKTSTSIPNQSITIGALNNNGTKSFFTSKETAFNSIGDGLTDTEASNMYTAVQNFQVSLNRQV